MDREDARMIAEEVVNILNKSKPLDGDTPMSAKETAAYFKMSMGCLRERERLLIRLYILITLRWTGAMT